ncbi:MAG: hypothetical protein DWH78_07735 [Planctomycetota bacterium]|nr:MAG: hypothetical protein DWH78_07735 [Planctomycetota bacterium]
MRFNSEFNGMRSSETRTTGSREGVGRGSRRHIFSHSPAIVERHVGNRVADVRFRTISHGFCKSVRALFELVGGHYYLMDPSELSAALSSKRR